MRRFCNTRLDDLRISVGESLLKLALALDTSVFHVLKVLRHVFHLVLEQVQILVLLLPCFNHGGSGGLFTLIEI